MEMGYNLITTLFNCLCTRLFQLRYGEPTLRRAVPLALALISVSNPRLNILDTLSKFSHDADPEVSHNSIFAMGMVGSGKCGFTFKIELLICVLNTK